MSTVKKPVNTQVEELRVLTDWLGWGAENEQSSLENWFTPELMTTVTTAVTNLVAVLAVLGWLQTTDVETLTKAITALVGGVSVVVTNSVLIWKYVAARFAVKRQVLEMKCRYAETVVVERMRAAK